MDIITTEGEKISGVTREIKDGSRPFESQVLTAPDGRTFRPTGGGQAEEITVMPEGDTELETALAEAGEGTVLVAVTEPATEEAPETPEVEETPEADGTPDGDGTAIVV